MLHNLWFSTYDAQQVDSGKEPLCQCLMILTAALWLIFLAIDFKKTIAPVVLSILNKPFLLGEDVNWYSAALSSSKVLLIFM